MKHPNYALYEHMKATWVARHPDATPAQYEAAIRKIAQHCGV